MNKIDTKLSQARARIILRDPFFASILMDMDTMISEDCETCQTNGAQVVFNPAWVLDTPTENICAAMRKMSLHVALAHHLRRGPAREVAKWQAACDQAAMNIMTAEQMHVPADWNCSPMFANMTADQIYNNMNDDDGDDGDSGDDSGAGSGQGGAQGDQPDQGDNAPDGQPSDGQGQSGGAPGQAVDGADMNSPADTSQKKADNDRRVIASAMAAKTRGDLPGFAKELVDQITAQGSDWRDHLQQFINDRSETRISWKRPNRRHVHSDLYLPGRDADGISTLAFIVDTSGSMSTADLRICANQIEAAREGVGITTVIVIQCDTRVHNVTEFAKDEPLPSDIKFSGRGGTKMDLAFQEAAKHQPEAVICLTDGHIPTVQADPGCAVMFAVTAGGRQEPIPCAYPAGRVDMPAPDAA